MSGSDAAFITRVVLSNYRSIRACSVRLGPLAFLVGPNGSGKSNFLDALRLISQSLNTSLDHALRERGGIAEVRRRSAGHPTHFGVGVDWRLLGRHGTYAFRVAARPGGGYVVQRERCRVWGEDLLADPASFDVREGDVLASSFPPLPAGADRLYLVTAASLPAFRPVYDALSHMGFYNVSPNAIRELQPPDAGELLMRDGANLAGVLSHMQREAEETRKRVVSLLGRVVPGVEEVDVKHLGNKETIEFRQRVAGATDLFRFPAESMSDGTLRTLGVLTALFQGGNGRRVPLVGIEEPEVAVHPGAAGVLRDAIRSAADTTQVIVTSHSPDLLDDKDIADDMVLAVSLEDGETRIGPPDAAGRDAVKNRLYTVGELLRADQIDLDRQVVDSVEPGQLDLFGEPA